MVTRSHACTEAEDEPVATEHFQFISITGPDDTQDQVTRRLARSHAVKQALENKRKLQQESSDNFRVTTSSEKSRRWVNKSKRTAIRATPLFSSSVGALDPFQTLAIDSSRLQTLLGDYKAKQAPEPVFSVAEELAFQSIRAVFQTGLVDPALLNAVMLSFAFAVAGGSIDHECLGYQGQAIRCIREKMSSLDEATSESTIGAILLLAGVEACLGIKSQVQLHMGAVQLLLETCRREGIYLTGGIKRAIFWQDLNCCILAGSRRLFDHTTFVELQWSRDPFSPNFFRLPLGFEKRTSLLTKEFIEVLEDIQALQCIRDVSRPAKRDVMLMLHINNHTASIQSRLVGLSNLPPVIDCCRLAAYVCSIMLCCKVWCALVIPSRVSSQLLRELQQTINDPVWDSHPDLLVWLLYIGGTFAPAGSVRSGYVELIRLNNAARFKDLYKSWLELLAILEEFVWSKRAFMSQVKAFFSETFT